MSSRTRAAVDAKANGTGWWDWLLKLSSSAVNSTSPWVAWGLMAGRQIGWCIIVTGMITAMPLIFEVKREAELEALEDIKISDGLAAGKSPQELAMSGLTSAVEPAVL